MEIYNRRIEDIFEVGAVIECKVYGNGMFCNTFAIIDTGGLHSSIDMSVASKINSLKIGESVVKSSSPIDHTHDIVKADLSLLNPNESKLISLEPIVIDLRGCIYKIIIGRDFLKHCIFQYNGIDNNFSIAIR